MLTDYSDKARRPFDVTVVLAGALPKRIRLHGCYGLADVRSQLDRRYGAGELSTQGKAITYYRSGQVVVRAGLPVVVPEAEAAFQMPPAALEDKPDIGDAHHGVDGGADQVTDLEADVDQGAPGGA